MNATDVKVDDVWSVLAQHGGGVRGLRQLTSLLDLVDGGSESPYESLTRILLVRNGFPRPQTQVRVCDGDGYVVARLDMGWPEYRVASTSTERTTGLTPSSDRRTSNATRDCQSSDGSTCG